MNSVFTWYESKNELRITKFGRGFPYLRPEYTGALFVLAKIAEDEAYLLNMEDDIQQFLDTFGLTLAETNRPVEVQRVNPEIREKASMDAFIDVLNTEFPSSQEMSSEARLISDKSRLIDSEMVVSNPDKILLQWTEEEYRLFRAIEHFRYGTKIVRGFESVDDFIVMANKVLSRRKSRAGKSLARHLAATFDGNDIKYTAQGVTEGNKKPDFIFPL